MFKGHAEPKPSEEFLKSKNVHPDQRRPFVNATVSSVAVGTYLGGMDMNTDVRVTKACMQAVEAGVNAFDSAINYRGQRGEKAIGEALRQIFLKGTAKREELFVSTKGGFVPFVDQPTEDVKRLFHEMYVATGVAKDTDLVAECHCMTPKYLENQLDRSRKNLGLETIDLYYIHNPETQFEEYPERIFYDRLFEAFKMLEATRSEGKIVAYGLATWSGFREEETSHGYINLARVMEVAKSAAPKGGDHGFKAIQLPFNFAMLEAAFLPTQNVEGDRISTVEAARHFGIDVAVSAPLYQGRLSHELPPFISRHFDPSWTDAVKALEFVTSIAGVNAAMVGMKAPEHVTEDTAILRLPKIDTPKIQAILQSMMTRT